MVDLGAAENAIFSAPCKLNQRKPPSVSEITVHTSMTVRLLPLIKVTTLLPPKPPPQDLAI
jgi:hypothetical protein